jgi:hypothetical protein
MKNLTLIPSKPELSWEEASVVPGFERSLDDSDGGRENLKGSYTN